ncbi:MAG: cytochrome c biogenesis protein ResB [Candidatus Polarisedimenticolaceae bacterium]|nr:cytochrome c biogenesis protein ResB [Candidatus Polarisedimenticolaceae bacterium]
MVKSLWRQLASHNLALTLIGLLLLAVAAGGTLPQTNRLSPEQLTAWFSEWPIASALLDTVGLSNVFGTWWFLLLVSLLLLNMTAGISLSIGYRLAQYSGAKQPQYLLRGEGALPDLALLMVRRQEEGGLASVYRRGLWGLMGIPLFHLGIALIVLAALWSTFEGYGAHFELSEGESYAGQTERLKTDKGWSHTVKFDALLRLDTVHVEMKDGKYLIDLKAKFSVQEKEGGIRNEVVETNRPLAISGYRLYPNNTMGYSAVFDRILPSGERRGLFIHFQAPLSSWGKPYSLARNLPLELGGVPLFSRMTLSKDKTERLALTVTKAGKEIAKRELGPGDVVDLGEYKLQFRGAVPWLGFYLASDRPMWMFFCSVVVTLLGYLLHLLIRFRRVEIVASEAGWQVMAWTMREDSLFERRWQQWSEQANAT